MATKIFLHLIFLNFLLVSVFSDSNKNIQCLLSLQIKKYFYQNSSNQVELQTVFKSNCTPFDFHAFFLVPFDKWYDLTDENHPKIVNLILKSNEFSLKFDDFDTEDFVNGKLFNYKIV